MKTTAPFSTINAPVALERQAEIHELLAARWSPRAFSSRPVEPEAIASLFEAARWAPSSANEQPWHFIAATKKDEPVYSDLFESLTEKNRRWATGAPLLILALARAIYTKTGTPNRHAWYDVGQSVASLVFEATSRGLAVHEIGGFDPAAVIRRRGIPAGIEPVVILAVGYPASPESLPEDLQQRERAPRSRKPLGTFVYTGAWGEPSHLLEAADPDFSNPSNN